MRYLDSEKVVRRIRSRICDDLADVRTSFLFEQDVYGGFAD